MPDKGIGDGMQRALLIIDMQRGLFAEQPEPFDSPQVVARINDLARRARSAGVPVVFVQHERAGTVVEHESDGWRLLPGLKTEPTDYFVRKATPDSFLRTNLAELLTELMVDELVICGYASEFCIDTTVRRSASLGYSVVIASDAHTTQDKAHASAGEIREHHNATLPAMGSFGAPIAAIPSSEVTFEPDIRDR